MEKLLKFKELMSGTRILWNENKTKIESIGYELKYKNAPQKIKDMYWWALSLNGIALEFKGGEETTVRNMLDTKQIMTNLRIEQELKDNSYILLNHDDAITIWVYLNNKNVWNELVEYFGSEERVWETYIRWRH